jgi:hypothetical protein
VKTLRVIGFGLFASAVVMIHLSTRLFQGVGEWTILHSLLRSMRAVDPNLFPGVAVGSIPIVALTLASLGMGLLASVLIYSPIHDLVAGILRRLVPKQAGHDSQARLDSGARE